MGYGAVAAVAVQLLYNGNNKNPSSTVFPCLSDLVVIPITLQCAGGIKLQ
jgi:hypothetical protein